MSLQSTWSPEVESTLLKAHTTRPSASARDGVLPRPDDQRALPRADYGPVYVMSNAECAVPQPIHAGVPFPPGQLREPVALALSDITGACKPVQTEVLARWPDGSVKWLLLDVVCSSLAAGGSVWRLQPVAASTASTTPGVSIECEQTPREIIVDTGAAVFTLDRRSGSLLQQVSCDGQNLLAGPGLLPVLLDDRGRECRVALDDCVVETAGPVRVTVLVRGRFLGRAPCRWHARVSFFAGTALVRVGFTLHNPRRARHPGGIWDLGDPGSIHFRELVLKVAGRENGPAALTWTAEPGLTPETGAGPLEIYQDSSGGAAWQSRNHIDASGTSPCAFRGYRVRHAGRETPGHRANPVVTATTSAGTLSVAVPEFWQQFPKAIEVDAARVQVSLFPRQAVRAHELQGGEQKTHTIWYQFSGSRPPSPDSLAWVHQPAWLVAAPECYADAEVFPYLGVHASAPDARFETLLHQALEGPERLTARRELIDEYGWRHFGELYADHEQDFYPGTSPVISHYNNQYDVVFGTLLHYLRTGDRSWWEIADPLARHVLDIDIYHTDQDRAAFNGGLFWHTDHYKDAATATHRCYSRANQKPGQAYGGGPCNEHNYTSGLLLYYYLTGDRNARDAVRSLANWVIGMDDGARSIYGVVEDGPSGTPSYTGNLLYQGPGRGSGNSINALLDGWLLTEEAVYLEKAEELIGRCIHPRDDIAARDLLNIEGRWSYTVFLMVLARYLDLKVQAGQVDAHYAYAQASLRTYAAWMVDHEAPYFDNPSQLEFHTETWGAQELRKANVLRLASAHVDEPLHSRLLAFGQALADRAWTDLFRFRPGSTRALAIAFVEGLKDAVFRSGFVPRAPKAPATVNFGTPATFVPQRQRIKDRLRSPRGLATIMLRLANPLRWYRFARRRLQHGHTG